MSATEEAPVEINLEMDRLEEQYQGAPSGFWRLARAKLGVQMRQGLGAARAFMAWLREEFVQFWDEYGRDLVFSRLALAIVAYGV
jgi:hypothetical protein